ncbi:MAG: hypothetical protein HY901_07815 [Deltaproteobacteria bacterium]|nr:hypothetical protein [Deltaproteobacteria bacterium]
MHDTPIAEMNGRLEQAAMAAHLDLGRLPTGEPEVFSGISSGSAASIPFLSAYAARWVEEVSPRDLTELAAALALYRPAPVELGLATEYLQRRRSRQVPSLHPLVDDSLVETMGFAIYAAQVARCLGIIAGVSRDQAEAWRRQMLRGGARGEESRQRFLTAAQEGGGNQRHLEEVSHAMLRFAWTAYPRAQADGMAIFAYRMTWLQIHHPDVVRGAGPWVS